MLTNLVGIAWYLACKADTSSSALTHVGGCVAATLSALSLLCASIFGVSGPERISLILRSTSPLQMSNSLSAAARNVLNAGSISLEGMSS